MVRGGRLQVSSRQLTIGTWNVEGLSDSKLILLQVYMDYYGISILCLQEVRKSLSDYRITDEGFLFISSGGNGDGSEFAGVGFLIHPSIRASIINFCQYSNRIASLKLRVQGGKLALISAYAPHAGRPFEERFNFFQQLTSFWHSISVNGPKICMGDFNSRLYCRMAGEEEYIGIHFFTNRLRPFEPRMNRFLLLEFCASVSAGIANTFFEQPADQIVTYRELKTKPMDEITPCSFAQLDLVLMESRWMHKIIDIQSTRQLPLASHHFLVYCRLDVSLEKQARRSCNTERYWEVVE